MSLFELLSFVTIKVFEFCDNVIFFIISSFFHNFFSLQILIAKKPIFLLFRANFTLLYTILLQNVAFYVETCPTIEREGERGDVGPANLGKIFKLHSLRNGIPYRPMLNPPFCNVIGNTNRSSHLGIHKQTNACGSVPRS